MCFDPYSEEMAKLLFLHCSECGTAFQDLTSEPRTCPSCGTQKWFNPLPVALILQPVESADLLGLAICRRAIEPGKGRWALIGGHINMEDISAEEAAMREFKEETGLDASGRPRLVYSAATQSGQMLLICVVDKPMPYEEYRTGVCCPENFELDVIWEPEEKDIVFSLHREAIERWFNCEI